MKHILVLITLLINLSAQTQNTSLIFPEDYLGIYKGDLEITRPTGNSKIAMEYHLLATDSVDVFDYKLVYKVKSDASIRDYTLKRIDKDKGEFIIDENNGILLHAKLIDNKLYNIFEVEGSLLTTTQRFYDNYMEFEIVFANKKDKIKTKESTNEGTEVSSYPIVITQKATLIKQ